MSEDTGGPNVKPEHLDRLSGVWRRIYNRKLVQWSVAYVALAYAIQHGVVLTEEAYEWPHAVQQISMLLMTLGLPVVITFAWYHGERASRRISGPELTIIAILLAIGSLFFYVLVRPAEQTLLAHTDTDVAAERAAGAISIAVLPFANLSGDESQRFFSDGITEEIISAMAKVPELRVVARTSASVIAQQNRDIPDIARLLHATHVIEGSVRKAGDRVRVTAQLINGADGTHVWSQDYDRQLTDIFAIQEDIARAITASLNMSFGLKPGENLVNNRSITPEDYQEFLRAKAVLSRGNGLYQDALAILEPLVARNPNYAPAWERLALAYSRGIGASSALPGEAGRKMREDYQPKMEAAARRAIELDPNYPAAIMWQAYLQTGPKRWILFEDAAQKALQLDAGNPEALNLYSQMLEMLGRIKDAIAIKQKLLAAEPFIPGFQGNLADALWLDGQDDAAIAIYNDNLGRGREGAGAPRALAQVYAAQGHYKEAADLLVQYPPNPRVNPMIPDVVRLLRSAPAKTPSADNAPDLSRFNWVYLYINGNPEPVLKYYEEAVRDWDVLALLWHSSYAAVRKTERFKKILRDANIVDYWRERGWPKFCHPTTGDDFACE